MPAAMRVRLLKQLMEVPLPAQVKPDGATPSELAMFKNLFREELVLGDWRPNHNNTEIAVMVFTGFSAEAFALVAESMPTARAVETTKRIGLAAWKVVLGIILLLGGLWAAIDHWPKIREFLGASPPPASAAPAQSAQGQQQQAAPAAQPLPSASTPTPPKQNP